MTLAEAIERPLADLLPHAAPMILLDRAVQVDAQGFSAEVDIHPASLFHQKGGVPAWIGLEYMAQAAAALAGAEALVQGHARASGMLVGSRDFQAWQPLYPDGQTLRVTVKEFASQVGGLQVMDCRIDDPSGKTLASARLNLLKTEVSS